MNLRECFDQTKASFALDGINLDEGPPELIVLREEWLSESITSEEYFERLREHFQKQP